MWRQIMSILFNDVCINEEILPKYTHTRIYICSIIQKRKPTLFFKNLGWKEINETMALEKICLKKFSSVMIY